MDYKFHNVSFSDREKSRIVEYAESRDWEFWDVIQSLNERMYKISFSWNDFQLAFQLSITPKDKGNSFYGYIVCVSHVDMYTLGKVMLWLSAEGLEQLEPPTGKSVEYDW